MNNHLSDIYNDPKDVTNYFWKLLGTIKTDISVENYYFVLLLMADISEYRNIESCINDNVLDVPENELHYRLRDSFNNSELGFIYREFDDVIKNISPIKLKHILASLFELDYSKFSVTEIFDLLLEKIVNAQGKISGEMLQPKEITLFVLSLLESKLYFTLYNPFAGLGSYGVYHNSQPSYYGQELNKRTWAIGRLRLWLQDEQWDLFYDHDDSFKNWLTYPIHDDDHDKFEAVVSTPPFNLTTNIALPSGRNDKVSVEKFIIEHGLISLKPKGSLILVIPTAFLYRPGKDKSLRERLVDDGLIESIILLPSGLFRNSGMPVCVFVINQSKVTSGYVKMVDASSFYRIADSRNKKLDLERLSNLVKSPVENEYQILVPENEIIDADYNLNVPRYFLKEYPGKQLSSIINPLRGERVQEGQKGRFVRIKDLKDDKLNHLLDIENVEVKELPRHVRKIEEPSLLLSMRWKTLKPTYFKYSGTPIYISNDIIALTIDQSKTDPRYLINVLQGENTSKQADAFRQGGVIPVIRKEDLLSIKVELPPIEEQSQIIAQVQKEVVIEEQKKLKSLIDEYAVDVSDENSFLRHQIAGSLKSVRKSFEAIKNIVQNQIQNNLEGVLDLKTNPNSKLSFGKYLEIIDRDLTSVHNSIRRTGKELEIVEFNPVEIDIVKFISEYCNELNENKTYQIKFDSGVEDFEEAQLTKATILGDSEMLRKMLDNIVENAEKHGFKNSTSIKNIIDVQMMFDFNDMVVQVDFSNTGEPLEDISHEDMIRKGGRAGLNGGDGYGMWFVNKIMKKHSGKFTFTDETGPEGLHGELVTTMELEFPIRAE